MVPRTRPVVMSITMSSLANNTKRLAVRIETLVQVGLKMDTGPTLIPTTINPVANTLVKPITISARPWRRFPMGIASRGCKSVFTILTLGKGESAPSFMFGALFAFFQTDQHVFYRR